jgi:hypothetical protein
VTLDTPAIQAALDAALLPERAGRFLRGVICPGRFDCVIRVTLFIEGRRR